MCACIRVCVHLQRIMTQEERVAINIMFMINTDIQEHKQLLFTIDCFIYNI